MIITTEELAYTIVRRCIESMSAAYDPRSPLEIAQGINDGDGWTFEASTEQSGWFTRAEGVRFGDDKLRAAVARAEEIVARRG